MTKMQRHVDPKIVEAEEHLLIDCQILLQETITSKNITRSALAEKAGISKARLSQLMRPEANPTIKTMARLFHALGDELVVGTRDKGANTTDSGTNSEQSADEQRWSWTEAPNLAAKVDCAQFVRLVKEEASKDAASNDNTKQVVVMESEVMIALEAA
jgi:transcriptional regulator with XRE-family HTH domain